MAILDYQMPQMDGLTLAGLIKNDPKLRDLRLIMLTSLGNRFLDETLQRYGIAESLAKPVRQSELYNAIVKALDHSPEQPPEVSRSASSDTTLFEKTRVLVAEDNIVNQKVALRQLQKLGLYADAVLNRREMLEAMDRIRHHHVPPHQPMIIPLPHLQDRPHCVPPRQQTSPTRHRLRYKNNPRPAPHPSQMRQRFPSNFHNKTTTKPTAFSQTHPVHPSPIIKTEGQGGREALNSYPY